MSTFSGLRSSLLFYFLENQILHRFLSIRVIFAIRADVASMTLLPKSSHWKDHSHSLHVIRNLKAQVYVTFRVPFNLASVQLSKHTNPRMRVDCRVRHSAVQMFGLVSLLPFSCTCTCAVVQKIACTQTGYSLLWPLLLLHCTVDLQHVLYAWSRADVLEQRRSCNGTNTTTSNLNSHITISIGISISRYHLNNRLSYRQRNSVSVHL